MEHTEKIIEEMIEHLGLNDLAENGDDGQVEDIVGGTNADDDFFTDKDKEIVYQFMDEVDKLTDFSNEEGMYASHGYNYMKNGKKPTYASVARDFNNSSSSDGLERTHSRTICPMPIEESVTYCDTVPSEDSVSPSISNTCIPMGDQGATTDFGYNCNFTHEVQRALVADTIVDQPLNGSAEYFAAAQEYAVYGKHFCDFPADLNALLNCAKRHCIQCASEVNMESEELPKSEFKNETVSLASVDPPDVDISLSELSCSFEDRDELEAFLVPAEDKNAMETCNLICDAVDQTLGIPMTTDTTGTTIAYDELQQQNINTNHGSNSNTLMAAKNFSNEVYKTRNADKQMLPNGVTCAVNNNMKTTATDRAATGRQLSLAATAGAATAATYYQLCANLRPSFTATTNSTGYTVLLNKANYTATSGTNAAQQQQSQFIYNQQQITRNLASNNMQRQTATPTTGNINNLRFPNPLLANQSRPLIQPHYNAAVQQTANVPLGNNIGGTLDAIIYAQMLQCKLYEAEQQQKALISMLHQLNGTATNLPCAGIGGSTVGTAAAAFNTHIQTAPTNMTMSPPPPPPTPPTMTLSTMTTGIATASNFSSMHIEQITATSTNGASSFIFNTGNFTIGGNNFGSK